MGSPSHRHHLSSTDRRMICRLPASGADHVCVDLLVSCFFSARTGGWMCSEVCFLPSTRLASVRYVYFVEVVVVFDSSEAVVVVVLPVSQSYLASWH